MQKRFSAYYQAMAAARAEMGQAAYFAALCWPGPPLTVEAGTQKAMGGAVLCTLGQARRSRRYAWKRAGLKEGWRSFVRCGRDGRWRTSGVWGGRLSARGGGVGALEHVLIPDLEQAQRRIRMQLEENDRANNTRLLKVKGWYCKTHNKR